MRKIPAKPGLGKVTTRRKFFKTTGQFAAASAIAGTVIPREFYAERNNLENSSIERSDSAIIGPKDNIKITKTEHRLANPDHTVHALTLRMVL